MPAMEFIAIPTEQTTAATDLMLACLAGFFALKSAATGFRPRLWRWVFGLLALAGLLGALAHGLVLESGLKDWLWRGIYLSLALTVALFALVVLTDLGGDAMGRRWRWPLVAVGCGFFAYTLFFPDSFLPFIVYELLAMGFALLGYGWLARRGRPGAGWLCAGVALTIVAAGIQATKLISFTLVFAFDHNGVYHLVQLPALWLLYRGARAQ